MVVILNTSSVVNGSQRSFVSYDSKYLRDKKKITSGLLLTNKVTEFENKFRGLNEKLGNSVKYDKNKSSIILSMSLN